MAEPTERRQIEIFISHSSQDSEVADRLANLLRSSLNLKTEQIRCTSIDGYRLPAGAETNDRLRDEALNARVFIGVLSTFSLASAYVLFELGARWGAKKPILPLLVGGLGPRALRGPLASLNALSAGSASQLHQLVGEIADALGVAAEPPNAYQNQVNEIVALEQTGAVPPTALREPLQPEYRASQYAAPAGVQLDEYDGADLIINLHCESEWPDDFRMRKHCMDQQHEALAELRKGAPEDIPGDIFVRIREKCSKEWPNDYRMRRHCEQQQIAGYRQLQRR